VKNDMFPISEMIFNSETTTVNLISTS